MPWIFYDPGSADEILNDNGIPVTFYPGMSLTLCAAKYSLDGQFLGLEELKPEVLHLCKDTYERLEKMFEFGLAYKKSVSFSMCLLLCYLYLSETPIVLCGTLI